ncbi:hypothetical protein [Mucilaginibacter phyllosphaerae]|uniref:Outer membrane protein beta-barrel domain-containing protein n=1 Tax=Mucilaginibacter phyllosphaerae TaxID=1812349 RepID=A0A4Y8ABU7_9SPHI|nr:hypothetical protein [Mucilaginibacter phyllosphaerae]MBB3969960.1 hypothetical protein [Mucilaginibacter phyllosphaerae]TEW65329.1 hypothetical protein E2R65_15585 [Mucilaginibacter phyllosphaerae]
MKKITLLFVLLAGLKFSASAQIQKGNVLMGGNLANLNLGLDDPKVFSFDLTPKAAWFIQDNVALGAYANLGIQTAKGTPTTTNYGVGALGRYYTGKDVEVLRHGRFFAEATAGLGGRNVSDGGGSTNGLDISVGPGFAYFITPSIGLETLLKYNGLAGFGNQSYQSNLNLSFGFQIYLPGRSTARKVEGDVR